MFTRLIYHVQAVPTARLPFFLVALFLCGEIKLPKKEEGLLTHYFFSQESYA